MHPERLLRDMASPDELVRFEAREELGTYMDDGIALAIVALAESDASEDVRADALVALGPLLEEGWDEDDGDWDGDPGMVDVAGVSREAFEAVRTRTRALYTDARQPALVRRRAFEVLIRDLQPEHAAEVRAHYAGGDPDWRRTAVFAMGVVPGFERELASLVATADGDLLFEAVRAAGAMEVRGAAGRIRRLAASEDTPRDLRIEAIVALPDVDAGCHELLEDLMESDDPEIADLAEDAMDELRFREQLSDAAGDDEE